MPNQRKKSFFFVTFLPQSFSGTATDTDTVNTPIEPLWPTDVHFGSFIDTAHLGVK